MDRHLQFLVNNMILGLMVGLMVKLSLKQLEYHLVRVKVGLSLERLLLLMV
jgi:hypothetical protein